MYGKTAFYARISKADKHNNPVSNSINGQLNLLYDAAAALFPADGGNGFMERDSIQIYIDDGYSGRSSLRPAFRKMVAKAVLGEVNTIFVKDFSRFSREHILMSEFLEQIFPLYGVRFISVTDCYDSAKDSPGLVSSFKSLFNEYYCKDISHKVKSVLAAKKEAGSYCIANLPFGYIKVSGKDGIIIETDEEEALIVQKIFTLAAEGFNCREIAGILNNENCFAGRKYSEWASSYVWSVINNPFYTGLKVWHKYESGTKLPKNCWRTSEGKHKAIIPVWLYNKANKENRRASSKKGRRHIFHGITKCKTCHKALCSGRRKKEFLCCNHCGSGEIKKIQTDILFKICLEKINNELLNCNCNIKDWQDLIRPSKYNKDYSPFYKELLLHNFIKKIEIGNNYDIDIYWNFINKP